MLSRHRRIARKVAMGDDMLAEWWPLKEHVLDFLYEYGDYIAKPDTFHKSNPFMTVPFLLNGIDWLNGYERSLSQILDDGRGSDDYIYYSEQKYTWVEYAQKQYREGSRLYSFAAAPDHYTDYLTAQTYHWIAEAIFLFIPNHVLAQAMSLKLKWTGFQHADDPSGKEVSFLDVIDKRLNIIEETAGGISAFFCITHPDGTETAYEILDGSTLRNTNMALYHAYLTIEPFIKNLTIYNLGTFRPVLTVPYALRKEDEAHAVIRLIPKGRVQEFLSTRADASGMPLSIMDDYARYFYKGQFK